jgi:hypothetical protein
MTGDKHPQANSTPYAPDAKKPGKDGHDGKAVQNLNEQVQDIQANGNLKPNANYRREIAKGQAQAAQLFGHVQLVDHGKSAPENHESSGDTLQNALHVGKTLASGVGDAFMGLVHVVEHGVEAAGKGLEHSAEWAYHNPGKAAAIGAIVVGAVVAEVATGGAATAVIAPALGAAGSFLGSAAVVTTFEVAGVAAAGTATVVAGIDVCKHGELKTLMNQQNESPEAVKAAREQLKKDTGAALLGDLTLGAGYGIKYGASAIAAFRAGAADATAGGETAIAATASEALGDHPELTPGENLAAHLAEETADAGAATAGLASLLDRVRELACSAGTMYEHCSGLNSTYSTVTNTTGIFGRLAHGYTVGTSRTH